MHKHHCNAAVNEIQDIRIENGRKSENKIICGLMNLMLTDLLL